MRLVADLGILTIVQGDLIERCVGLLVLSGTAGEDDQTLLVSLEASDVGG